MKENNSEHPYTGVVLNGFGMLAALFAVLAVFVLSIVTAALEIIPAAAGIVSAFVLFAAMIIMLVGSAVCKHRLKSYDIGEDIIC